MCIPGALLFDLLSKRLARAASQRSVRAGHGRGAVRALNVAAGDVVVARDATGTLAGDGAGRDRVALDDAVRPGLHRTRIHVVAGVVAVRAARGGARLAVVAGDGAIVAAVGRAIGRVVKREPAAHATRAPAGGHVIAKEAAAVDVDAGLVAHVPVAARAPVRVTAAVPRRAPEHDRGSGQDEHEETNRRPLDVHSLYCRRSPACEELSSRRAIPRTLQRSQGVSVGGTPAAGGAATKTTVRKCRARSSASTCGRTITVCS